MEWRDMVLSTFDVSPVFGVIRNSCFTRRRRRRRTTTTSSEENNGDQDDLEVFCSIPLAEDLVSLSSASSSWDYQADDSLTPSSSSSFFSFRLLVPKSFPELSGKPLVLVEKKDKSRLQPLLKASGAVLIDEEEGDGCVELEFPWLEGSKSCYGLGAWCFAVRGLFLNREYKPWSFSVDKSSGCPLILLSGAGATKGRRAYMEDVHFCFPSVNISGGNGGVCSVFGVLDGHGGVDCSRFAMEELPTQIVSSLRAGQSSSQSLYNAFLNTDEEFLATARSRAGSTATVLLWNQATGIANLANAGDSRAVIYRDGAAIDLSRDMKAADSLEVVRIARAGGYVANGRVNGSLAIARAIGDKSLKKGDSPVLTAAPEIVTFRFQPGDEFLIIASDGLWDVMSSQSAVDMAKSSIERNEILADILQDKRSLHSQDNVERVQGELSSIANAMANNACNVLNSQDNITVMIILVHPHQSEEQARKGFRYPETASCPENRPRFTSEEFGGGNAIEGGNMMEAYFGLGRVKLEEQRQAMSLSDLPAAEEPSGSSVITSSGSADSACSHHSTTVEKSSSLKESIDDDDDVMSFLLDDSNF